MKLGNKIRKIRELRNYTQEYMALQLEMSVGNYSKIERDDIPLTIDRLEDIAKILDVNVVFLIEFNEFSLLNNNNRNTSNDNSNKSFEVLLARIEQLERKMKIYNKD
jgi:transcriptional regulator with XRE-family HTH domain